MTTAAHPSSRRPRVVTTILASTLVAGSLALGAIGAQPAGAADPPEYQDVRLCDATACLFAWDIVDSDGDGVSDADEIVAGTDPHDPASSPPLQHIAEIAIHRELPSFEAGLSAFVLLPADIKAIGATKNPLEAFPMGKRKTALELLGVSPEKLAAAGIDPLRSGLTIGLDHPSKDGGLAPVRVGGIDVRLISSDPDFSRGVGVRTGGYEFAKLHGGMVGMRRDGDMLIETYADGARLEATFDGAGWKKTEIFDEKGNWKGTDSRVDPGYTSNEPTPGDDGVDPSHEPDDPEDDPANPDDPHDDDDDPSYYAYVDPNADSTEVTADQIDFTLRTLGSAVLTVQDVDSPDTDPSLLDRPGTTILVDAEQAGTFAIVLDAPRVTRAQPEYGNRLPSPVEAAPPTNGGFCNGLCG